MVYGELGLTYYHVYYPGEIQVSDKPQKNIVGYDSHSVYTFADHKKKPMSGNAEMRNNMVVPADVCADFAVSVRERKKTRYQPDNRAFRNEDNFSLKKVDNII